MKLIIAIMLTSMFIQPAQANTYIEVKNELPFRDFDSQQDTTHLRLGYKFDNNMYVEAGPMTDGKSFEKCNYARAVNTCNSIQFE